MEERDNQRVADILDAAGDIASIVADGENAFRADRVRQLAVERLLEIVGEAARAMTEVVGPSTRRFRGQTSWACGHCSHITTNGWIPTQLWVIAARSVPVLVLSLRAAR